MFTADAMSYNRAFDARIGARPAGHPHRTLCTVAGLSDVQAAGGALTRGP